jgi:CheY-like chemotaxis protein
LTLEGYNSYALDNPDKALAQVMSGEIEPDMIIVDFMMVEMNGIEFT